VQSESYNRIPAVLAEDEILLSHYCLQGLGTEVVLVLVLALVSGVDMVAEDHESVTLVRETVLLPGSHHLVVLYARSSCMAKQTKTW
jgi:hypothetical protein